MAYKATINIDRELWDKAGEKCSELGTNRTKEITAFLEAFLADKPYLYQSDENWQKMPESVKTIADIVLARVKAELNPRQLTIESEIEKIECLQNKNGKSLETHIKTDTETDMSTVSLESVNTGACTIETDIETDIETGIMHAVPITKSLPKSTGTMDTSVSESVPNHEEKDSKEDWNRRTYSDKDVSLIEGLTKTAVGRYRIGKRQPQDKTFWDRWEKATNTVNRWWKVKGADFSQVGKKAK